MPYQTYRKVTAPELERLLGVKLSTEAQRYRSIKVHVGKYYPKTAVRVVATFANEYDDSFYSGGIRYLAVYDKDGEEILPLKVTASQCRAEWGDLSTDDGYGNSEHCEPREDLTVYLAEGYLPELYVREETK